MTAVGSGGEALRAARARAPKQISLPKAIRGRRGIVRAGARPCVSSCVLASRATRESGSIQIFGLVPTLVPYGSAKTHLVASRVAPAIFALKLCLLCAAGRAPVPAAPPPAVSSTSERGARRHVRLRVCGGGLRACERGCACVALTGRRRPGGLTDVPRVQGWLGWARGE